MVKHTEIIVFDRFVRLALNKLGNCYEKLPKFMAI